MEKSGSCVYNEIVGEPLLAENHKEWFEWVKNYLIAQDLWEVVDGSSPKPPEDENHREDFLRWRRKNAAALHAIHISCERSTFSSIRRFSEAKKAWQALYQHCNPKPESHPQLVGDQVEFDVGILRKAICDDDWCTAKAFLDEHPSALTAKLDDIGQTCLHFAALFGHVGIAEELVRLVPPQFLQVVNNFGDTPLIFAAYMGVTGVAKCMLNKNSNIVGIPSQPNKRRLPVTVAFSRGHREIGDYLYSVTPLEYLISENGYQGVDLLFWCFTIGALDVVLDLLQRYEDLLFAIKSDGWGPIQGIATLPSVFANASQLVFWKQWIYNYINIQSSTTTSFVHLNIQQQDESKGSITGFGLLRRLISRLCDFLGTKELHELKLVHAQAAQIMSLVCENLSLIDAKPNISNIMGSALIDAAKEGNVEFVVKVAKAFPQIILFQSSDTLWNIFFYAVKHRQAEVFNVIHELRFKFFLATQIVEGTNSMLHVAGELAPPYQLNRIPGPALQMQRELQWFKEVESIVPRGFKVLKNVNGMQPQDIFKESHKELRKEGEKWIKGTASSCSVVGALIVTIMFAVAFTVPGGNNQDSTDPKNIGYPIFLKEKLFILFIISDALSLFSSSTSVLIFLGILTSRYQEEDFLKSLPTKLIIGLSTLFLSVATMMIAFSSCILLMLQHTYSWSFLPIIMLASIPVTLFVLLQFPLLVQMVSSTYGPGIFKRNLKQWL